MFLDDGRSNGEKEQEALGARMGFKEATGFDRRGKGAKPCKVTNEWPGIGGREENAERYISGLPPNLRTLESTNPAIRSQFPGYF